MKSLVNKIATGAALLAISLSSPSKEKSTIDEIKYIPNDIYKGTFEEFFVPSYLEPLNDYVAVETKKPYEAPKFTPLRFRALENSVIDDAFVKYIINVESNGNANATSSKGAMGRMQLMPETWYQMTDGKDIKLAYDAHENTKAGKRYLKWIEFALSKSHPKWEELNEKERKEEVARSYNYGIGNYEKTGWNSDLVPEETKNYVNKLEKLGALN